MTNSKLVKINSYKYTYEKFSNNASVSGLIWRAPELAALAGITLKRPVLDLGCGDGRFTKILFKDKLDLGLDISDKDIQTAKTRGTHIRYIVGDAHEIKLKNNSIQTVFSNSVVEHIPNLGTLLKEINRILKINGELIFTTHAPSSKDFFGTKLLRNLKLNPIANLYQNIFLKQLQLESLWSKEEWKKELTKTGFIIEEFKNTTGASSIFWYEFFMPFTFLQNRLSILKSIPFAKIIFSLINPNVNPVENGRNFFVRAKKVKTIKKINLS